MMNEPTNRAMRANANRKVLKKPRASRVWVCCSEVSSVPVMACTVSGRAASRRRTSSSSLTPSSATTETVDSRPSRPRTRWAVARSNTARVAPSGLSTWPKRVMPTTVNGSEPDAESTVTWSPRANPSPSAVALSITTSPGPAGGRPSARFRGLTSGSSIQLNPRVGAPWFGLPIALPSLPTNWAYPVTSGEAVRTPGTAATSPRIASSSVPR